MTVHIGVVSASGGVNEATLTYLLYNSATRPADVSVNHTVDGTQTGTREFTLLAGEQKEHSLTATYDLQASAPATDSELCATLVGLDGEACDVVTVNPPGSGDGGATADIQVTSLAVSPVPATAGTTATAEVRATNFGDAAGDKTFDVTVNGTRVGTVTFALNAGENGTGTVEFSVPTADSGTVAAGGTSYTFDIKQQQPAVQAVSSGWNPDRLYPGDDVTLWVEYENKGSGDATHEVPITVEGTRQDTVTLSLAGGEAARVEHATTVPNDDALNANIGDVTFNVQIFRDDGDGGTGTPNIQVTSLSVAPSPPLDAGQEATAVVRAENFGDAAGTRQFSVKANGSQIGTVTFGLGGGSRGEQSVPFTVPNTDTVTLAAGGTSYRFEANAVPGDGRNGGDGDSGDGGTGGDGTGNVALALAAGGLALRFLDD